MPVGAISPDKGPAGGASNIGVLVLKELRSDRRSAHPVAALCAAMCELYALLCHVAILLLCHDYLPEYVCKNIEFLSACGTIGSMRKEKPKTSAHGVRLRDEVWPLLRQVMRHHGRAWMESFIIREHKKIEKLQQVDK